jgi:hypothetical protein
MVSQVLIFVAPVLYCNIKESDCKCEMREFALPTRTYIRFRETYVYLGPATFDYYQVIRGYI